MNPEENQNPVADQGETKVEEPQVAPIPAPTPTIAEQSEAKADELMPEVPAKVEVEKVEEVKDAEAPVSFDWKKPIIWMVVIGVVALGIWLVANTL